MDLSRQLSNEGACILGKMKGNESPRGLNRVHNALIAMVMTFSLVAITHSCNSLGIILDDLHDICVATSRSL